MQGTRVACVWRVARRYLYKVHGPEACNFPVSTETAAELDALTLQQIREQFKHTTQERCVATGLR